MCFGTGKRPFRRFCHSASAFVAVATRRRLLGFQLLSLCLDLQDGSLGIREGSPKQLVLLRQFCYQLLSLKPQLLGLVRVLLLPQVCRQLNGFPHVLRECRGPRRRPRLKLVPAVDDRETILDRVAGDDEVAFEPGGCGSRVFLVRCRLNRRQLQ